MESTPVDRLAGRSGADRVPGHVPAEALRDRDVHPRSREGMLAADESVKPLVVAVTDEGSSYNYPTDVEYEIRQGTKSNYARAAELVNYKAVRWVSLQHEYGIFGGDDGAYILDFLGALRVPAAVTLHTVLDKPSPSQRAIVQKMAKAAVHRRDEPGRRGPAGATLRAADFARRDHPPRHPGHVAARPGAAEGALRRRRAADAGHLRPAGAEQGDRDGHPRPAGPGRAIPRPRLLRRRRHASSRASPERRGLPHVAGAAGRAAWPFASTSSSAISTSPPRSCAATCRRPTSS